MGFCFDYTYFLVVLLNFQQSSYLYYWDILYLFHHSFQRQHGTHVKNHTKKLVFSAICGFRYGFSFCRGLRHNQIIHTEGKRIPHPLFNDSITYTQKLTTKKIFFLLIVRFPSCLMIHFQREI